MIPTWFTVFFWSLTALIVILLIFEEKLVALERKHEENKRERRVKK